MGRRYFSHGSSFGRTLSCFIVRSSAHDSVVFAVGRFRLRTRGGDASQLRSRARRKNMDSVHSPCRVDALHHAAQLLQAGLRDADGVLLLDGDEELGRHGRSLPRVREQVPLERPDGGHDCLAPFEVTPGQKNRRGTETTKTAAPRKAEFLERGDETTTTAIIDRAPGTRLEPTCDLRDTRPRCSSSRLSRFCWLARQ